MTKQILVVDDAATVRLYHRKLLAEAGWAVDEAINGVDAMERVLARGSAQPFDLFVVDVNMPKMDGFAFVGQLRRQAQAAPVLMVSTEAQAHDTGKARQAGANAYLIKPARPAELLLTAALLLGDGAAARRAAARHGGMGVQA